MHHFTRTTALVATTAAIALLASCTAAGDPKPGPSGSRLADPRPSAPPLVTDTRARDLFSSFDQGTQRADRTLDGKLITRWETGQLLRETQDVYGVYRLGKIRMGPDTNGPVTDVWIPAATAYPRHFVTVNTDETAYVASR
ncbi:hypothetical protein BIV57_18175 [Mangrovactinospora gilvigrisea]|uniref:Lipoprotein n=1 Tax=Mangrovactinospora gilvigrisea TaxID=1428644 RepID=A0A1J7BBN1_9ACTN|nr:hypothetical protein [Mangrovactinospora gilvigrisea]OIV36087.1 hypothetical protein BIV57_18175 [Mangrovactinospora gilvigrisea]